MACRHRELGEGIFDLAQLQIAALGDLHGPLEGGGGILEERRHLLGAFYKELVRVEFEAVGLLNLGPGLHAEHHVVGVGVFAAQVMRVVGRHERNPQLALQAKEIGPDLPLVGQPLILNFKKEVLFPKISRYWPATALACLVLARHQGFAQFARKAAGKADEPLGVFREVPLAHPWLAVEAVQRGFRRQPDQVAVAFLVLGQHQQVVVLVVGGIGAVVLGLAHVKLAAEDGLYALGLGRLKEMHGPVNVAVVGHGHRLLAERSHAVNKFGDVAGAVEE